MRGERILYGNSTEIGIEGMKAVIEKYGSKFGHQVVATVQDELELNRIIRRVDASVFILNPAFPRLVDGRRAILTVQFLRPKMKIITISGEGAVTWGNINMPAPVKVEELIGNLNELQH